MFIPIEMTGNGKARPDKKAPYMPQRSSTGLQVNQEVASDPKLHVVVRLWYFMASIILQYRGYELHHGTEVILFPKPGRCLCQFRLKL